MNSWQIHVLDLRVDFKTLEFLITCHGRIPNVQLFHFVRKNRAPDVTCSLKLNMCACKNGHFLQFDEVPQDFKPF